MIHFRPENASGEPYKDEDIGKMVTFVEFFCMLIRKLGGADALRASLKQFEMREDGTIEREWLEGKICNRKNHWFTFLIHFFSI